MLTKKQLQKCTLGSNLCVPQELGPTQMAGILPPRPRLPPTHSQMGQVPADLQISIFNPFKKGAPKR